jgi:hypothetical protein
VPPGLPVYAIGLSRREALAGAGLHPVEIRRRRAVLLLAAGNARAAAAALRAAARRAPGALVRYQPAVARLTLFAADPLPNPARLRRGPVTTECAVEQVAERGAWKRPVPLPRGDRFLAVRGWALAEGRPAAGVYAVLDGRPFAAAYGFRRALGPADEPCRGCDESAFEALLPLPPLPRGPHRLGLWVLGRDGRELRPCARQVQLRAR